MADSKKVKTPAAHLLLLWRLLARLQDGHAEVRPLPAGKDVVHDVPERSAAPGLFLCCIGERVFTKNVWGAAANAAACCCRRRTWCCCPSPTCSCCCRLPAAARPITLWTQTIDLDLAWPSLTLVPSEAYQVHAL